MRRIDDKIVCVVSNIQEMDNEYLKILKNPVSIRNPIDNRKMLWYDNVFTRENWPGVSFQARQKQCSLPIVLEQGRGVLDIGAHIGDYGIPLAHALRSMGNTNIMVYCIDPSPAKCDFMEDVKQLNGLTNVKIICAGIADKPGKYSITTKGINSVNNNPSDKNTGKWQWIPDPNGINFTTLDALYGSGQIGDIGFFWLDAQWSEHLVLRGGENMLTKCRPKILMEYTPPDEMCDDNISVNKWRTGTPKMLLNDPQFEDVFLRQPLRVCEGMGHFEDILLEYELPDNAVYIGASHTETTKIITLDKEYDSDTEIYFVHGYSDQFETKIVGNKLHVTRVDQTHGWSQKLVGYIRK